MIVITVDKEQLVKIKKYVNDERFRELLRSTLIKAGLELQGMIIQKVYEKAYSTGLLAQSFDLRDMDYNVVKIFSTREYAEFVEYGTKPHRPPFEPILQWTHRTFRMYGKRGERRAWAIWWKIAKKGTPAKHFAQDAIEAFNLNKWVKVLIEEWENVRND